MAHVSDPRQGWDWTELRRKIVRRDGGICALCGLPGATSADHIVPHARGGRTEPSNLQAAHLSCNQRKSDSVGPLGAPSRKW